MATESARTVSGPKGLPILGNLLQARGDPLGFLMRSWREFGDFVPMRFGPFRYFFVNDPGAVHHVLVANARNYKKSRNYRGLKLVLGEGLVTSEGDFWRRQRKLAQPAFHRERLAGFAASMATDTASMLERWEEFGSAPFCVHKEMLRLTFRIVGRTLFGVDVDDEAEAIGPALGVAMHFAIDYVDSTLPLPVWVPTPRNLRFRRALRTLDALVLRIIQERRAMAPEARPPDLLTMLMAARDEGTSDQMNDRQLRDEVMTLVLAGHETTANALTWTWYLLSTHPDVARRLRAEVADVLGGRVPRLEDLPRLRLTTMVIEESMRLFPPVWGVERQAIGEDTIDGHRIPAGATVGIAPFTLHRHTAYWENPEGFDPDRFAPELGDARPRYVYLPFGAGPRHCIGNSFAMMEAQIILAMVAQRAQLDLVPGHPVELDPLVTLRPRHGMVVRRRTAAAGFVAAGRRPAARNALEGRV